MPKVKVNAAVWCVDTDSAEGLTTNDFASADLNGRLASLKAAVDSARLWYPPDKGLLIDLDPELNMFIAPEYLFSKSYNAHALSANDAATVEHKARALSVGILLIPGTISWKKPLDRSLDVIGPENAEKKKRREEKAKVDFMHSSRLLKAQARLEKDRQMQYKWLEKEVSDPLDLADNKRDITDKQTDKKQRQLLTKGKTLYMVQNTAYVFYNSQRVLKYRKRGDFSEVISADKSGGEKLVFIPGDTDGFFSLAHVNLDFGIEVCLDHNLRYLSNTALKRIPDVHLISSAWVKTKQKKFCVKNGGFVIHASSNPSQSGVYDANALKLTADKTIPLAQGTLSCFNLEVNT